MEGGAGTRLAGDRMMEGSVATRAAAEPGERRGIVASAAYAGGQRIKDIALDEAGDWAHRSGHFVWIGLHAPDPSDLEEVRRQFDLHPLAIEDAGKAHQQPKLERYGETLFIVARTAQIVDGHIAFGETHLFIGRGFLVSVRHGASASYTPVRLRYESCPTQLARGETYVLHGVLDFIVDNYMPVIARIHEEVEAIEDKVLAAGLMRADIERLYELRRDLLKLRNAVVPLVEVCRRLEHPEVLEVDEAMRLLFRDVTDHVRRVQEDITSLREVLAFAFEASLLIGQAEQTVTTRRLAAWAAILAVPTAIAGIYGMNFDNMPELRWAQGYFLVLGVIIAACGTLYVKFRRLGWL
ncbi:magnesium and cobalt transport protein CorA [Falsiroseomonas sp. HW251]|uniref:magnesium and cobalt transport protein CorA n=1 Tax=Falsiroseomonas sp. HW251 TaxID=3390998 RepID=UPI003D311410